MCDCCCCTDYILDCDNINLEEDEDGESVCICFERKSSEKNIEKEESLPKKQTEIYKPAKPKYFTRDEVVIHCSAKDIWIIINKSVFNLTPFIKDRMETMNDSLKLLIAFAGKDLSHYFDEFNKPRMRLTKSGNFVPLFIPTIENVEGFFSRTENLSWWEDPVYIIGWITESERDIRIFNTLTKVEQKMTVCEEDSIYDIIGKYKKKYNHHAGGYTWRKDSKNGTVSGALSFERTLTQNGIFKEKNNIGPPPSLWLFYNDDFTIA